MNLFPIRRDSLAGWLTALLFVGCWYALLQLLSYGLFNVSPNLAAMPRDLGLNMALGALLYAASRSLRWYLPAMGALMALLHLSNAGKIAVLGGPVMPDDLLALKNLFLLLEGWQLAGLVIGALLPPALLVGMIAWRERRAWGVIALLGLAVTSVWMAPVQLAQAMDRMFGNIVWNQRGNFESRGVLIHLVQESARQLGRGGNPPSKGAVVEALKLLQPEPTLAVGLPHSANSMGQRNLHLIVLESFWDPLALTAYPMSEDPLDPRFRQLWAEAGHSRVLSPVFGGYTANAEFEVLCGFPVTEDAVFFEGWLTRDVPCLPAHLSRAGYRSIASHPNIAAFWNRVNAYRRIGFDDYWSINDFALDDMNREFLSDASLYRQVLEKLGPLTERQKPVFNYVLTFFGHLDYPLNERRPQRIQVEGENPLVPAYINTLYYKSRELMDFLHQLRSKDPDGLIVLFGDHLPFLGPNFAGFTESGLFENNRSLFDAQMFDSFTATPLVVIDGERGPLRLGSQPMYRLPDLILGLLGEQQRGIMGLPANPGETQVRPLPGMQLVIGEGAPRLCRDGEGGEGCRESGRWLEAVSILNRDLFGGEQHTLTLIRDRGSEPTPFHVSKN